MSELWVCLAPDTTTGSESEQIVAVCPTFDQSWSEDEAVANGYIAPWDDPSKVHNYYYYIRDKKTEMT